MFLRAARKALQQSFFLRLHGHLALPQSLDRDLTAHPEARIHTLIPLCIHLDLIEILLYGKLVGEVHARDVVLEHCDRRDSEQGVDISDGAVNIRSSRKESR